MHVPSKAGGLNIVGFALGLILVPALAATAADASNEPRFREKMFYHRATRHAREAYAPALAADGRTLAYLQVAGDVETLMLQRGEQQSALALSAPGYLFEPRFAGDWLTWVEQVGADWVIRGARWRDEQPGARTLVAATGRPIHLVATVAAEGVWLGWEERVGRQTQVCLVRLEAAGIAGEPVRASPAGTNAYDPALAVARDGTLYCAYSAYYEDSYRILLARFNADGSPRGAPRQIGDTPYGCVWPSLWPAARGGVWWSYTSYSAAASAQADHGELISHVKHERYLRQRQFFDRRGVVQMGWWDGERPWVPMAMPAPQPLPFHLATGLVFRSEGAGHSQILEDASGGVHVVLRQHAMVDREPVWEQASAPLQVHERFRAMRPHHMHPNLSVVSLVDGVWQPPAVIVPRAHFDLAINLQFDGRNLALAFGQDVRRTGWSLNAEWFDEVGEIGLGVARIELPAHAAEIEFRPLAEAEVPAGRWTTPRPPSTTVEGADGRTFVLGQTHCHSNLSVCQREFDRDPHFNYRFMQDVQHCRFGALTDHEYNLWQTEMLLLRKLAEYYYFPGEFVALPGYEWTGSEPRDGWHDGGPFGHVTVLGFESLSFRDFHNPFDLSTPGHSTPKLWRAFAGRRVLMPPHHMVDYAHWYQWKFWNRDSQPFVELFQDDRGSAEQAGAPGVTNASKVRDAVWVVDELRRGRKFGFVAAGDHRGLALAGVWTLALTREALYAALHERACYGTTGVHAAVLLTCNGRLMGSEGVGTNAAARFTLAVASAEPVALVEVLRNGEVVRTFAGDPTTHRWEWTEPDAASGDFWYCRIHWADGELAWASPVWL